MDLAVISASIAAASVLVFAAGSRFRLPGGVELKEGAEELLNKTGRRFGSEESRSLLKKKLVQANIDMQPEYFTGLQYSLPVLTIILFLPMIALGVDIYWAVLPAAVSYFLPGAWLNGKVRKRLLALRADIPDFCSLLGTALKSGADFLTALEQVSAAMEGELAGEIRKTLADIATGDSRAVALNKLAARCGIPDLSSLIRKIRQAIRYGSPIEPVVTHHAEKILERQKNDTQKAAGELTIKLLFPIVIFILLPLFLLIGFPVLWNIFSIF